MSGQAKIMVHGGTHLSGVVSSQAQHVMNAHRESGDSMTAACTDAHLIRRGHIVIALPENFAEDVGGTANSFGWDETSYVSNYRDQKSENDRFSNMEFVASYNGLVKRGEENKVPRGTELVGSALTSSAPGEPHTTVSSGGVFPVRNTTGATWSKGKYGQVIYPSYDEIHNNAVYRDEDDIADGVHPIWLASMEHSPHRVSVDAVQASVDDEDAPLYQLAHKLLEFAKRVNAQEKDSINEFASFNQFLIPKSPNERNPLTDAYTNLLEEIEYFTSIRQHAGVVKFLTDTPPGEMGSVRMVV